MVLWRYFVKIDIFQRFWQFVGQSVSLSSLEAIQRKGNSFRAKLYFSLK